MVKQLDDSTFTAIYNQYMKIDFPRNELKPLKSLLHSSQSVFYGYYGNEELLGYSVLLIEDTYCLMDYFAILPKYRNSGHGSRFLQEILSIYQDYLIMIESESPNNEIAKKRIAFYQRNHFILSDIEIHLFHVDYFLLSNQDLNEEKVLSFYQCFYPRFFLNHLFYIKKD